MSNKIRFSSAISIILLAGCAAFAQTQAQLRTSDTELTLEALPERPRVVQFDFPGQPVWQNRGSETLIPFVEIAGEKAALTWTFDSAASRINDQQVVFVYNSAFPHLRLSWEWRTREEYGPVEHQIRIENLDSREIWIPMQDSLAFDWQVDSKQSLQQLFVEKGADKPSNIGTHRESIGVGFHWTGTSSTYGDLFESQPREIIPWTLVERNDAAHSGWYAGIEFSGRTRIALTREKDSLKVALGLNPDPGPFRTRLKPGESFESPIVFFGGFRDGPDGAGNILRPWVRAVLGNPETWKNSSYPLIVNNSWGCGMEVNEEIAMHMIRDSAELGVNMFHVDAGWFRDVGDWSPNPQKFPHGLAVIADYAHKHGLRFGMWVDWTQAGLSTEPGALNARDPKVRDWMLTDIPADWKPEPFKGQTIDLGVPEAKTWARARSEPHHHRLPSGYAGARWIPGGTRMRSHRSPPCRPGSAQQMCVQELRRILRGQHECNRRELPRSARLL